MQIALLVFIVVFALAIGFFLGLFLLSLDSPLLKNLFQKDDGASDDGTSRIEWRNSGWDRGIQHPRSKNPVQTHNY